MEFVRTVSEGQTEFFTNRPNRPFSAVCSKTVWNLCARFPKERYRSGALPDEHKSIKTWLKRAKKGRHVAGHPLLARHRAAAVDMASDGERAPSRRLPTRVRASSTYRTSPANKSKISPTKVKRRSAAAEPILSQLRGEPIVDRRGNQHDTATGRFTRRAAGIAPSVATDARPSSQAESGRSSPSFRSITSSVFHAHIAAGDTSEEDDQPTRKTRGGIPPPHFT